MKKIIINNLLESIFTRNPELKKCREECINKFVKHGKTKKHKMEELQKKYKKCYVLCTKKFKG